MAGKKSFPGIINIANRFLYGDKKNGLLGTGFSLINPIARSNAIDPSRYAYEAYRLNAIAYYCINRIATDCAMVPLKVYKKKTDGTLEVDNKHVLNDIYIGKPSNPSRFGSIGRSGYALQRSLHAYMLINGNAYLHAKFRNLKDEPVGLPYGFESLRPDKTTILSNNPGEFTGYRYNNPDGGFQDFPYNLSTNKCAVHQLKDFNPLDDFYGMSPVEPAAFQIDIANEAAVFNKGLLQNGARLSIALKHTEEIDDDDIENLRSQFIESFAGTANSGRPIVLDGGLELQELGITPRDMEYTESQYNAYRLTALVLGYSPYMLGLPGTQSTYNNMSEAKVDYYQSTVKSRLTHFYGDMDGLVEGELNIYLQNFFGEDVCIKPYWEAVDALAPLRDKRFERLDKMKGVATINEQREIIGLPPLDDEEADQVYIGLNEAPLTFATDLISNNNDSGSTPEDNSKSDGGFEFKLINDASQAERQRELIIFGKLLDQMERLYRPVVGKDINALAREAADGFNSKGKEFVDSGSLDELIAKYEPKMVGDLSTHYRRVSRVFGNRIVDAFNKSGYIMLERKEQESLFDIAVRRFIEIYSVREIRKINDTTKANILTAILEGENNGESRRAIAKRIVDKTGGKVSRNRATMIAATETHAAASYAQVEAGKSTGIVDSNEWISAEDGRVRPDHARVDGQIRKEGESFDVGGEKAQYPGDPSLSAEQRILCRCTLGFIVDESTQRNSKVTMEEKWKCCANHNNEYVYDLNAQIAKAIKLNKEK